MGTILGLLEVLDDAGGRDDAYRVAGGLQLELDDFLPVLDGAKLLGLVDTAAGDVFITAFGRAVLGADVGGRKELLADRMAGLPVFQEVLTALRGHRRHRLRRDHLVDTFARRMSDEDAAHLVQTVVDWGRYAELLGYDTHTGDLFIDVEAMP